ncbi:hypothetical protein P153DRAFT_376739 [Dothidotthia symphoricarpi CBS 119687]|uniref:TM7S3/TM198-like domain-containing protein n=1 Tax=Dothidotthia symphoricarpi CBS 119687 TaxID=1392245 RepID=A0A6A6AAQ0_9PLEO|nr:uncharacterized protein P153DRAFT_376739 [Dothidotthia symphoricarpi CBS 119687]KAF2128636.1 hypothetical protein P153DRAFT_376739 [Dothidotthia symphoricarpi CBS 119687]
MRSHRCLVLCVALFLCLQLVVGVPHSAVRRQNESESPTTTETGLSRSSSSITPSQTSASLQTVSDSSSSAARTSVRSSSSVPAVTTSYATTSTAPTSSASAAVDSQTLLPYQPKLTPAMGISGVVLILTGIVYATIGFKNKWIYVFGSAAYLSALAVTVLIIYLMSPPVTNAIEGAFFVAAFITGMICGGVSLVFSDITEGFGCLLGGFCLSMWFLSLKAGGLIASTTGRAIFIGCMSAGGYSLSFSHYTRNYGLIASISFSGATATVLGIDCLSSTGWKEFWLYLWNLNDNTFPLNTNTYPLTKHIKAELAGVFIIAVFGIVSQLRVWKLVKEHREKSVAHQLEKQQDQDRVETALGKSIEDSFQRERAQWESTYGEKGMPESSGASLKDSTHVQEREVSPNDSLELVNVAKSGVIRSTDTDTPAKSKLTVNVLEDDAIHHIDAQGNPIPHTQISNHDTAATGNDILDTDRPLVPARSSLRSSVPPTSPVMALPFAVPEEDEAKDNDDNTSTSAMSESEHELISAYRPVMSKRISDMSGIQHENQTSRDWFQSGISHNKGDRASSVAAILDENQDNTSLRQLSPAQSPTGTEHDVSREAVQAVGAQPNGHATEKNKEREGSPITNAADSARPIFRQSLTASTDPKHSESQQSKSAASDALSDVGSLQNVKSSDKVSKVASSHRTNEWAQQLEAADKPDFLELAASTTPQVTLEGYPKELSAPVSDEIAAPLKDSRRNSKRASTGSGMRRSSGFGLGRSTSNFSLAEQQATPRSPYMQTTGDLSRSNSGTNFNALSPMPMDTLMGQRENRMKNRVSSHSLTPHTSSANLLGEPKEQEDMTLAQRRQLVQKQSSPTQLQHQPSTTSPRPAPPSASQKWQKKSVGVKGAPLGFDSHQPSRTTSTQSKKKREELYAEWRDSVQEATSPKTAANIAEQQRIALINEKRQAEMKKQQRESMAQQRASMMDSMMRSGQMLDAHREAMRKLQANADKKA